MASRGSSRAIRAGRAFIELFADETRYIRGLAAAERRLRRFGNSINRIGRTMVATASLVLLPMGASAKVFAAFEDQMLAVKAITQATDQEFKSLTDQAKELGRTTSFTAEQVGAGMVELARAFGNADDVEATTDSVLTLARATGIDLAEAALTTVNALRMFKMGADRGSFAADVLTATANNSTQNVSELAEALSYAGPVAQEAGESLASTAQIIGVMANIGVRGSKAGTALRTALSRLGDENIRRKLQDLLQVNATDMDRNLRPMADILLDIGKAASRLPTADRLDIYNTVFGRRALSGTSGASSAAEEFDKLAAAIGDAEGVAKRTADIMDSGMGGAMRRMMSALEAVQISIGESLKEPLTEAMEELRQVGAAIAKWIDLNPGFVRGLAKASVKLLGVGLALIALSKAIGLVTFSLGALATAIAFIGTPFGLIVTGLALVSMRVLGVADTFGILADAAKGVFKGLAADIKEVLWTIKVAIQRGDIESAMEAVALSVAFAWESALRTMEMAWLEVEKLIQGGMTRLIASMKRMWERAKNALTQKSGRAAFLNEIMKGFGIGIEVRNDIIKRMDLTDSAESAQKLADALAKIDADELDALAKATKEPTDELKKLATEAEAARVAYLAALKAIRDRGGGFGLGLDFGALDEGLRKMREAGDALRAAGRGQGLQAAGGTIGQQGIFTVSTSALLGLSAISNPAERTANATERTARNTKNIEERMDELGQEFV
jgi:TP901 family phage tail tape measure protein